MTKPYHFFTVSFMSIYDGQHYFRLIDSPVGATHKERMEHFDKDINGCWEANNFDPQYSITAYEIDMEPGEMLEEGITSHVFRETYWDQLLQGAV